MTEYFRIGVISSVHGIRGEVKVYSTTDDLNRYKKLKEVYFLMHGNYEIHKVVSCKFFKGMAILKFEGIDTPEEATKYRQVELYVDRPHALPLAKGQYYMADLIDAEAYLVDGTKFGTVKGYFDAGHHYVLEVTDEEGVEHLIPSVSEFVKNVDVEKNRVTFALIKGM